MRGLRAEILKIWLYGSSEFRVKATDEMQNINIFHIFIFELL